VGDPSPSPVVTVFFPGIKRPKRKVNHTLSPDAEVMSGWGYTSTPLHKLKRENLIFFLFRSPGGKEKD
jgi:hypothetical protein